MKTSIFKLFFVAILALGSTFSGCNQKPKTPDHLKEKVDMTSMEYASAYICPMHCEGSGSNEPGNCPVCKMDYVKNKGYVEAEDNSGEATSDSTMMKEVEQPE